MIVHVELPDDTLAVARRGPDEVAREMRLALAVRWYADAIVSQGAAAAVAGLSRAEFIDALGRAGVSACQETEDDIREALAGG